VTLNQVLPFTLCILLVFAFALDPDRGVLERAAAGLYWVAVLLAMLLTVNRSFSVERNEGARDVLATLGLDPTGSFVGKVLAVLAQLAVLQIVLAAGIVVLYNIELANVGVLVATGVAGTIGLTVTAVMYAALASNTRMGETLLPLLLLPAATPILIGATRATEAALANTPGEAWPWVRLLVVVAIANIAVAALAAPSLMEES
jgi:heme exporter protein B